MNKGVSKRPVAKTPKSKVLKDSILPQRDEKKNPPHHESLEVESDLGDITLTYDAPDNRPRPNPKDISTSEVSDSAVYEFRLDELREIIRNHASVTRDSARVQAENTVNITELTKGHNDLTRSVIELVNQVRELTLLVKGGKGTGERRSLTPTRASRGSIGGNNALSKTDSFIPRPHTSITSKR